VKNFFMSIFTDGQWDGDAAKVFGIALILAGVVGWWMGKSDFQWIIGFGAGLVGTGKFSAQG
jgi:hypothetical protein